MAPINLPDGSEVSEVILPDGTTASEVIAPDGSAVFSAIPDSVVNRLPLNEGSGTSATASVGNVNGTLNNDGKWESNNSYPNGTAPEFDVSSNDYGSWQPRAETPITWTLGVDLDSLESDANYIFGHNPSPYLSYDNSENRWLAVDEGGSVILESSESKTNAQNIRYLAIRLDTNTLALDIYESDASTKVGSDSSNNPNTTFDTTTNYFGDRTTGGSGINGNIVGPFDVHDEFVADSDLDNIMSIVYG